MKTITYDNAYSTWDEALMLGNGRMGAMAYLTPESLVVDLNHYDVYYRTLRQYRRSSGSASRRSGPNPYTVDDIKERALAAHEDPASPAHNNYNYVMNQASAELYGVMRTGASQPLTAEIEIHFAPELLPLTDFRQELDMESGMYRLRSDEVSADLIVTADDRLQIELRQDPRGGDRSGITTITLRHPDRRLLRKETAFTVAPAGVAFTSTFPDHDSFSFTFRTVTDATGALAERTDTAAVISIPASTRSFVAAGYLDPGNYRRGAEEATRYAAADREKHAAEWRSFWAASSVRLPDPMLERLWYVNLYSLRCASGKGAELYEQACGLNGLWDIKQPSQWGSMWYWDVNIQQAFWPIYTANHAELGSAFYDALESYIPAARERAKSFYGIDGIAADYPFAFYYCIWPWCAQFFWWHYRYTGDMDFLRTRALPLFSGIIDFFRSILTRNQTAGHYDLFPDIAPEQGPVTTNSTISISTLKFVVVAAVRAGEILGTDEEERAGWRELLEHLPPYAEGDSETYGRHIKDSEWAEPDIYMAHSSPLMVIYPIGEYSKRNPEKRELLANTIAWMEHEQNLGTHNFGWLAAAYARLGDGDAALRMLHEKGIAYQMRTNGLFAEETERWMQNCLTACLPVYNPPLMEAGSAVVAAVNEMLLQSFGDAIEVFPALPHGTERIENARYDKSAMAGLARTPAWTDCSFTNLRAEGGFLVSAEVVASNVAFVEVESLLGGKLSLINPFGAASGVSCEMDPGTGLGPALELQLDDRLIVLGTLPGHRYRFTAGGAGESSCADDAPAVAAADPEAFLTVTTRERRRVYLGKCRDTDFIRAIDGMTHDYFAGDQRVSPISVYRFDFSTSAERLTKDYREILERQFHGCGKMGLDFTRITRETFYETQRGYGFADGPGTLRYIDRGAPDPLRRDCVAGDGPRRFLAELARGTYRILVVSGDQERRTETMITFGELGADLGVRTAPARTLRPGEYHHAVVSVMHPEDGCMTIGLESRIDEPWKLAMMVINRTG